LLDDFNSSAYWRSRNNIISVAEFKIMKIYLQKKKGGNANDHIHHYISCCIRSWIYRRKEIRYFYLLKNK